MNDPLDIPLTANDIQDMDPVLLAGMWAKVRASRQDLLFQRTGLQEELVNVREAHEIVLNENFRLENKLQRYTKALAKVALRSTENGGKYK